jgi:hypothetical protein
VDDACDVFLRTYVNNLYGKYCCKDVWINSAKFESMDYTHFKRIVNLYLKRIFKNYIPPDVYEQKHPVTEIKSIYDGWGEDSYVVTYIIRSLKGYFLNRMVKYNSGKYIECKCGEMTLKNSNRQSMCEKCFSKKRKDDINENAKKYYKNKKDFIQLENTIKPL